MKLLVDGQIIVASGDAITFGESDESFDKWSVFDKNGELKYYCLDGNYELVEVEEPEGFREEMYSYVDGNLVRNTDWHKCVSPEERIATLEETVALQDEQLIASDEAVVLLYEMQMTQDEINGAQDEAITGLYELMLGGE